MNLKQICFFCLMIVISTIGAQKYKSTADERVGVEVTVYNNNIGLVKEQRDMELPFEKGELQFVDVAALINPVTVHAQSIHLPRNFIILEQNYEYDLISHHKLLEKYVGKTIKIIDRNEFKDRSDVVEAELLSVHDGEVYKIGDEIYLGHPGIKVLPEIPQNLVARPTLTWNILSKSKKKQTIEVSYLTDGISWSADYVLISSKNDSEGALSGWVTIENKCGATFPDASLKLVAGKVNRVSRPVFRNAGGGLRKEMMVESASSDFAQENLSEYHMYDLQRKTTIKNNQTKQISLLEGNDVKLEKEYLVRGQKYYFNRRYRSRDYKVPVETFIKFTNSEENGLGMPLPEGTVRIYTADSKGRQQFIGEDRIEHTPKEERVKIKCGEAFDIVAEQKQIGYKKISTQLHETQWEVKLRNRKDKPVTVGVIQTIQGNWDITESNLEYEKIDAFTVKFNIPVKENRESKLKYTVRVGLR